MGGRANDYNWACNSLEKAIKSGASPEQVALALARTPQFIAAVAGGMSTDEPQPGMTGSNEKWQQVRDNLVEALEAVS